jgi:hypothetical protein
MMAVRRCEKSFSGSAPVDTTVVSQSTDADGELGEWGVWKCLVILRYLGHSLLLRTIVQHLIERLCWFHRCIAQCCKVREYILDNVWFYLSRKRATEVLICTEATVVVRQLKPPWCQFTGLKRQCSRIPSIPIIVVLLLICRCLPQQSLSSRISGKTWWILEVGRRPCTESFFACALNSGFTTQLESSWNESDICKHVSARRETEKKFW